MSNILHARNAYSRDAILAATPAQLVVLLYDRLVLDLRRAEAAQAEEAWLEASAPLLHAQAIVTELQISLKLDQWDGAERLFAIYSYVRNALVSANMNRDIERTRESLRLILPLNEAWRAAAEQLSATRSDTAAVGDLGVA